MADTPPKGKPKRPRGRPRKEPVKAPDLSLDQLAEAAADAAEPEPGSDTPLSDTPPGRTDGGDPKPRRGKRVTKKGTQQIEEALAELLQIPAVPAAMFGDAWMAEHFTFQGRQLANRIAIVSERNPVLRSWCERMMEGESIAVLLMAGLMYAAPPLMHFGVIPGGSMMGIPVLTKKQPAAPAGFPAPDDSAHGREPVPAQQYGGEPVEAVETPINADTERVVPNAHFVGGENGDGPPLWTEQMIEG